MTGPERFQHLIQEVPFASLARLDPRVVGPLVRGTLEGMVGRVQASRASSVGVLALALLVTGALLGTRSCGERYPTWPPAIVATADRYTVAWMRPAKRGGALLVQQFSRETLSALGPARVVVEREDLEGGGVEIMAVSSGYVVTSRVDDPEGPMDATHMLVVPLDGIGRVSGEAWTYFFDYACHGVGLVDDQVVLAYVRVGRSHKLPNDMLGVVYVDHEGDYVDHHVVGANARHCAIAVDRRGLAVVRTTSHYKDGKAFSRLHVTVELSADRNRQNRFDVMVGDVAAYPVRVARYKEDWAILYADLMARVHVAVVDNEGALIGIHDLPADVDARTVDLASNGRGKFVTWAAGGRVRSLGIDGTMRSLAKAGSRASKTRALGDGTSCVTAWTVGQGESARIGRSPDCP